MFLFLECKEITLINDSILVAFHDTKTVRYHQTNNMIAIDRGKVRNRAPRFVERLRCVACGSDKDALGVAVGQCAYEAVYIITPDIFPMPLYLYARRNTYKTRL